MYAIQPTLVISDFLERVGRHIRCRYDHPMHVGVYLSKDKAKTRMYIAQTDHERGMYGIGGLRLDFLRKKTLSEIVSYRFCENNSETELILHARDDIISLIEGAVRRTSPYFGIEDVILLPAENVWRDHERKKDKNITSI